MILRVWAMYDRSKLILRMLSIFYVIEVFYFLVVFVIYSIHGRLNPTEGKFMLHMTRHMPYTNPCSAYCPGASVLIL